MSDWPAWPEPPAGRADAPGRADAQGRADAHRRALERVLLGAVPVALTVWLLVASVLHRWIAEDFSLAYYPAAHRLLTGGDPYAFSHAQVVAGAAFVYPPLSAVLLSPLALLPLAVADHVYTLICLAMVPASLRLAGVRDWRVYGITLLWFPMVIGWQGENVSVPLMFLAALAWRARDRPLPAGLVVAVAVSVKPFMWPLALWLLATRRFKAAAWSLAWLVALNLLAWYVVGFDELSVFLRLSSVDLHALWRGGYGVMALAGHAGLGYGAATVLLVLAAAVAAAAVLYQGLRRHRQREVMVLTVALMLIASPVVWIHYFVLLLVPLAISRPRFAAIWAVPLAMWLLPPDTHVDGWQLLLAWGLSAACVAAAVRGRPEGPMLDLAMAQARRDLHEKFLSQIPRQRVRYQISGLWPTTSMGSQQRVKDNESTDTQLSSDGKI